MGVVAGREPRPRRGATADSRKASNAPGITYDEALESALCYGWIDGQAKGLTPTTSCRCSRRAAPGGVVAAQCRDHARLTDEGRMRAVGIQQVQRAQADGRWEAAYGQKGTQIPTTCRQRSTHPRRPRRPSPR